MKLLPDASILNRFTMVRGVGQIPGVNAGYPGFGGTEAPAYGFWNWARDTFSPVIESVTPGVIAWATGQGPTDVAEQQVTQAQAQATKTQAWLWPVVIGAVGLAAFGVFRARRR